VNYNYNKFNEIKKWIFQWIIILIPVFIVMYKGYINRWVCDDAFITFRVADNLLNGYGPVFNVGERVEVYTHPLWLFLLTIFYYITQSIEYSSVFLGILFSSLSILFINLAWKRYLEILYKKELYDKNYFFIIGSYLIVSISVFWDFVTSGLETGLVFFYLSFVFWIFIYNISNLYKDNILPIIVSLGVLIRPDLGIFFINFILLYLFILFKYEKMYINIKLILFKLFLFVFLPLVYQIFRMGYFASIVPNTAIAKSAFSFYIDRGIIYFLDFFNTYFLYFPIILGFILIFYFIYEKFKTLEINEIDYKLIFFVISFLISSLLYALYVILIGGDFMHARFLLPSVFAFFVVLPPIIINESILKKILLLLLLIWCFICINYLRVSYNGINEYGIANEREFYIRLSHKKNPVTLEDYSGSLLYLQAANLKQRYTDYEITNKIKVDKYVALSNIGISGFLLGSEYYIFDLWCIADPIGARFKVDKRGRPGHEKTLSIEWINARIGQITNEKELYAKKAMECGVLRDLLDSIHGKLTLKKFLLNIVYSYKFTKIRIPKDTYQAYKKFCRNKK